MSIFDKWNKEIGGDKLAKDVKEIEKNGGGEYPDIPHGEYEVSIAKMELKESKKGDPMFAAQFKILEGEHKGSFIFMNQVTLQSFQIGIVNEFLRSLDSGLEIEMDGNFDHWNNLIMDVAEAIEKQKLCYLLDYGKNSKGYNTFKIKEVYEG